MWITNMAHSCFCTRVEAQVRDTHAVTRDESAHRWLSGMPKPIEITSECLSVALNRFEVDECDGYPSMEQVWSKAEIMYFGIPICEYTRPLS